jgi:hypothetical protein
MKEKIILSGAERTIFTGLKHPLYTAEHVEHWINRNDLVFINAPAALQAAAAKGFYEAVKAFNDAGYRVSSEGKYEDRVARRKNRVSTSSSSDDLTTFSEIHNKDRF